MGKMRPEAPNICVEGERKRLAALVRRRFVLKE